MELDLHRLELRFAAMRIVDAPAVQRLANSIQECGQLVECVAAGDPEAASLVLIDGYRRVAALRRLGRDTAQVQCWSCPVGQALTQVLARSGSRPFTPIEEAMLLRELIDAHGLTQRDAARNCARDVSWVQRRLVLLGELPEALLAAVRSAQVSSWAATRVFAPLARANKDHANRLLASLDAHMLSTRELRTWFDHYQSAQREQRERMVEHPHLFIHSLNERELDRDAQQLREGPERDVVGDLGHLRALLERVRRRLEHLSTPVAAPIARACGRVHAALPEVASELGRLCDDADRDPQRRAHAAATGHGTARDSQAAGAVA
jgi:ParB-like chromosome segregation protein Spo0J